MTTATRPPRAPKLKLYGPDTTNAFPPLAALDGIGAARGRVQAPYYVAAPTKAAAVRHLEAAGFRVYGASDDTVQVDGGTLTEEFHDHNFDEGAYVLASTGDVIQFRLTDDGWRADIVFDATGPVVSLRTDAPECARDEMVTIAGPVHWITATTRPVVRA